jgi:hypothetical protein
MTNVEETAFGSMMVVIVSDNGSDLCRLCFHFWVMTRTVSGLGACATYMYNAGMISCHHNTEKKEFKTGSSTLPSNGCPYYRMLVLS